MERLKSLPVEFRPATSNAATIVRGRTAARTDDPEQVRTA
jgi:hypothetical protein